MKNSLHPQIVSCYVTSSTKRDGSFVGSMRHLMELWKIQTSDNFLLLCLPGHHLSNVQIHHLCYSVQYLNFTSESVIFLKGVSHSFGRVSFPVNKLLVLCCLLLFLFWGWLILSWHGMAGVDQGKQWFWKQVTETQFEHELVCLFWLAAGSHDTHFLKWNVKSFYKLVLDNWFRYFMHH